MTIKPCDFCKKDMDLSKDRWLFQDDGSYIHIDCIEPALTEFKRKLDEACDGWKPFKHEEDFKLLSKLDPREPFGIENWHETCEWCGHITESPNETHVCKEQI